MDKKTEKILISMMSGKTREEVAKELNYKSYRSLDAYMRRRNYIYDSKLQSYICPDKSNPSSETEKDEYTNIPAKAASIIKLFDKKDTDPKTIAKLMRFSSYNEMAVYMKSKGYIWSIEKSNYVSDREKNDDEVSAEIEKVDRNHNNDTHNDSMEKYMPLLEILDENLEKYISLLNLLDKNKELIFEELLSASTEGIAPRYIIPGVFITKSVHMSYSLNRLVKDYSQEKNISQREIFEIALVDFFRQYGYKKEIETLLNS